ncbi:glycosyltransferase family 4 protein [Chitinophaga sp. Hz27]|uniref:glycosyltransferase family 4 protein n=1 Tax=Chitinophaga sp. Hz27 TaxID=3347169 RepID=UPI0035E0A3D3
MTRYVFDCERMKYPNTGLYTYCLQLGKAMLAQLSSSEEMSFYVPANTNPDFGPGAKLLEQKSWHKMYMPYRERYDVWHTAYQSSRYTPANRKTNRVFTIHDLNFLYENKPEAKCKRMLKWVQAGIDSSAAITTISEYVKRDIEKHLDTRGKSISVIYNGCDVAEFPGFDSPDYKPATKFLFTLGTVLPKKNFHVLPCLLQHNDMELIIAGNINEAYAEKIRKEAVLFGVTERVKIIGPVKDEDKYWYLKNCTAFVFPSLAEGFGIPVIEAMHFGKPVFISDLTSLPEIGGEYAYYFRTFEPNNMQAVLKDGLADFEKNGNPAAIQQHADSFCWKKAATEYLEIYRSCVK